MGGSLNFPRVVGGAALRGEKGVEMVESLWAASEHNPVAVQMTFAGLFCGIQMSCCPRHSGQGGTRVAARRQQLLRRVPRNKGGLADLLRTAFRIPPL